MTPAKRLSFSFLIIIFSGGYGVLVVKDPDIASAVMLGYVAILLTAFVLIELWRKK